MPQFDSPAELPNAETGMAYSQTIAVSGGNGALTVELIGLSLPAGLAYNTNTLTIAGMPAEAGSAYVYLRVVDADNDPAWRTFSFPVVSRSTDPAVTVDFEGQATTGNDPVAIQPMIIGDYSFFCPQTTIGLTIHDQTLGWPSGWESKVLHGRSWGNGLGVERVDGEPFDLFSFELGSIECDRVTVTAYQIGGGTSDTLVAIPKLDHNNTPLLLTHVELDLVSVLRVDFTYHAPVTETNSFIRSGALDNLLLNQITAGSYDAWARTIEWDGASDVDIDDADNDTLSNAIEYAMDLNPVVSNGPPSTIVADATNAYINYRRSTMATSVVWKLCVTDSLLNTWSHWPVDNVNVFSDLVDPDVDGDQSAELMRYRIPMPAEDQSLFFRIDIE